MTIPDIEKICAKLEQAGVDKVRKNLAMGVYAESKIKVIEEWLRTKSEETISAKPPVILQNIAWFLNHGRKNKLVIIVAVCVVALGFIVENYLPSILDAPPDFDWGNLFNTPLE